MLIESTAAQLTACLGMLDGVFHSPARADMEQIFLRWLHFVGGITWIGLLYFFNLVNVPLQKTLDADTKKRVNPALLRPALWYFRWAALVTVIAGFVYYALYILRPDVRLANLRAHNVNGWILLVVWLFIPIVVFLVEFLIIKKVPASIKDGRVFAIVALVLVAAMTVTILKWLDSGLTPHLGLSPNKTLSIGVGGAYGIFMMLNVWGIIWPNNKRILAGLEGGPAAAPELARQAFIASRTNAWLSLPMLLFMGTSSHDWQIFSGK